MSAKDRPEIVANPSPRATEPPSVSEPTKPAAPLPPTPDQAAPLIVTATGARLQAEADARAQQGAYLTTAQGVRLPDTDHSLKAGDRGPTLLQDHHLREKITHFDHERIPERVVHARGAGAHGTFVSNGAAAKLTKAAFLQPGVETPVFCRFSTVLGFRGSADTPRDTRGFAVKFYTAEGIYDLVGNNIPVFFIQDGIKFPDLIHAAKPEPDREIPQAASAHDTFWDFVSLHTEAQHMVMWNMSDRGIPASLRALEGFGVHTFRLVNAEGESVLVKFHWKPKAGLAAHLWEEAQLTAGNDPDAQRRDLADAIQNGAFPQWDLGIQVFPDTEDETFAGIDLLDPTKLIPEELAPVQIIGTMTLDKNPTNYFAETEQIAFHPGHLVPGIDLTNDPLLQARMFSYLDTQITRLGGPNFAQLPINRPHVDVNDNQRDGYHQDAVHAGVAPYKPNSLGGGCPFHAGNVEAAYIEFPQAVAGQKVRESPASFDDHFSQPRMYFRSLTPVEQEHVIAAYAFELSKCMWPQIRERQLGHLVTIDERLGTEVAKALGMPVPKPDAGVEVVDMDPSPALSMISGKEFPIAGRHVAILADESTKAAELRTLVEKVQAEDALAFIVGPHAGTVACAGGSFSADKPLFGAASIEFDAIFVTAPMTKADDVAVGRDAKTHAPEARTAAIDPRAALLLSECFRHGKPIGATQAGAQALTDAGIGADEPGVNVGTAAQAAAKTLKQLRKHRVWERLAPQA